MTTPNYKNSYISYKSRDLQFLKSSTNVYSYGFNGMEADDEISGNRNSYDFGARMYNPRLGRWMSMDPLSKKQPSQSPYKAMLNNPIYWIDPDGKTEYETIIIKDEKSGTMIKVYVSKSNKLMTDGVVCNNMHADFNHQHYYDYRHLTTYTIATDGTVSVETSTEILFGNGAKYKDYVPLDYLFGTEAEYGDTYDPDDKFVQAGGFYMTSGKGQGTKYHSSNAEYVGDIDDLVGALGGFKKSTGIWKATPGTSLKEVLNAVKALVSSGKKMENLTRGIEEILKQLSQQYETEDASSDIPIKSPENNSPLNEGDTIITINQWERGSGFTMNHTKDTVVKKSEVENVDTNREYNPKYK